MSDKKITQLTGITTLTSDDLFIVVNDPSGNPTNNKITLSNLIAAVGGHLEYNVINNSNTSFRFAGPGQSAATPNPDFHLYKGFTYKFRNDDANSFKIVSTYGGPSVSAANGVTADSNGDITFVVPHTTSSSEFLYEKAGNDSMRGRLVIN